MGYARNRQADQNAPVQNRSLVSVTPLRRARSFRCLLQPVSLTSVRLLTVFTGLPYGKYSFHNGIPERIVRAIENINDNSRCCGLLRNEEALSHSQELRGEPLLFLISALGSFTCSTQHTGPMALRPIRKTRQWLISCLVMAPEGCKHEH